MFPYRTGQKKERERGRKRERKREKKRERERRGRKRKKRGRKGGRDIKKSDKSLLLHTQQQQLVNTTANRVIRYPIISALCHHRLAIVFAV